MTIKKSILLFTTSICFMCINAFAQSKTSINDRRLWLNYMDKIARPVIKNLAENTLKANMPVVLSKTIDNAESRSKVAYLEAFGRTLSGIAPWLQLEGGDANEVALRNQYRQWALQALDNATDSTAKDYLQWSGGQPLVDASYVAFALLRCPWLWEHSSDKVKNRIDHVLKLTRSTVPVYSNWILFSGMIEAFFCKYDLGYDPVRVEFAVREFANHWYVGDGMYSDGMEFHLDYYNSIVIHPNLTAIVETVHDKTGNYSWYLPALAKINERYAQILERLIAPDGTYPATGRSIVYRGAVFHHLADAAYRGKLPATLHPAQVRSALTAVIKQTLDPPGTYTKDGWLNIGLHGSQPGLADFYITTGSLYICCNIFLPLGLPSTDDFWSTPAAPWTSVRIWNGEDVPADHALDLGNTENIR